MALENPNPQNIGKRVIRSVGGVGTRDVVKNPTKQFAPGKRVTGSFGGRAASAQQTATALGTFLNLKATGIGGRGVTQVIGGPRSQGRLKF